MSQVFLAASKAMTGAGSVDEAFEAIPAAVATALAPHKPAVRLMLSEAAVVPSLRRTLHAAYGTFASLVAAQLRRKKLPSPEAGGWAMFGAIYVHIGARRRRVRRRAPRDGQVAAPARPVAPGDRTLSSAPGTV